MSDALLRLAQSHGIAPTYRDVWGKEHRVSERTLRALLSAMAVDADTDERAERELAQRERALWRRAIAPVVVARLGARLALPVHLPASLDGKRLSWRLVEEGGEKRDGTVAAASLTEIARKTIDGEAWIERELAIDVEAPCGYHRLSLHAEGRHLGETRLIVAPARCHAPPALSDGGRVWGAAAQLYSLRSGRNWGIGDFTDLAALVDLWAAEGAGVIGVNPLHALFPHNPAHASPYSPSSRLFLNTIYIDVEAIPEFEECESARTLVSSPMFRKTLRALRDTELVNYPGVAEAKSRVLSLLFAHFRSAHLARGTRRARAFRSFCAGRGEALLLHARFEALQEHFFALDAKSWGPPAWPEAYRDPRSAEVERFAKKHAERIDYFRYLQWHAGSQLGDVGRKAAAPASGVGLYVDLAVSIDRAGAEAWSNQDSYTVSASVGAPPDEFNMRGQNWGLPPLVPDRLRETAYAPFIATLRANMRHAGALRIDHVLGLNRLFWIPGGADPADGAYVHYPIDDLLGILALESQAHRCMVIGEDLGTVPEDLRGALDSAGVLSYRVLLFERDPSGEFKRPAAYPKQAIVTASTHDLPTLAGWWEGLDIALRAGLGLFPSENTRAEQLLARAQDRARLLRALEREGLLPKGLGIDPVSIPTMTDELARAIQVFLARTPSQLMVVQLEDVVGVREQVNLPATTITVERRSFLPLRSGTQTRASRRSRRRCCARAAANRWPRPGTPVRQIFPARRIAFSSIAISRSRTPRSSYPISTRSASATSTARPTCALARGASMDTISSIMARSIPRSELARTSSALSRRWPPAA
jgi:(1->4)-alpha-D-glucan 1-alpha-D-glucosylmutase